MRRKVLTRNVAVIASVAMTFVVVSVPAGASTEVTLSAAADAYVDSTKPNTNFGGASELDVSWDGKIYVTRSLARFSLVSIPADATIEKATFGLYLQSGGGATPVLIDVGRVLSSWKESSVTYANAPGAVAVDSRSVGTSSGWYSWDVTDVVQAWMKGSAPNYGLAVGGPMTGGGYDRQFMAREKGPAPRLIVVYTLPTPTPTPTPTPDPCADTWEPNETFATALSLEPLEAAGILSFICTSTDHDFFRFNVAYGDMVVIDLDGLPKDYNLVLFDPAGSIAASSTLPGTEAEHIEYEAANFAGEFRVLVAGAGGAFDPLQPYHLTVQVNPPEETSVVVNTTDDADDGSCDAAHCSLREAIDAANDGVARVVEFSIPTTDPGFDGTVWTIRPPAVLPTITAGIEIRGRTQADNRGNTNTQGPEIVLDGSSAPVTSNGLHFIGASSSSIEHLVLSGWGTAGVRVDTSSQVDIVGCYIGTDASGRAALPNAVGVVLNGGHSHHIGGPSSSERNVIAGNDEYGLAIYGSNYVQVRGNLIGLDAGGMELGNAWTGVLLEDGAEWNRIGGTAAGEGNVISENGLDGIHLAGEGTDYNVVVGNRIGVSQYGIGSAGNGRFGVHVSMGRHNEIGGDESGEGNVIGGSASDGVRLDDAHQNTVAGNSIGVIDGTSVSNTGNGVALRDGSSLNTIGPANLIARNGGYGIVANGSATLRNTFTESGIEGNASGGISLQEGANDNVVAPVIAASSPDFVSGVACPRCTVEVFSDDFGQGASYQGTVVSLTSGAWRLDETRVHGAWTATATDDHDNTSEFSTCTDIFEPNDDVAHATPLTPGTAVEGRICTPGDVDVFTFDAVAGDVVTVSLEVPDGLGFRLGLVAPDGSTLETVGEAGDYSRRVVTHTALADGTFTVIVDGEPELVGLATYELLVEVQPIFVELTLWIDEGWLGDTEVFKVIPDSDGPADVTWLDVVARIVTTGDEESREVQLTLHVPGDRFGAPEWVMERARMGEEMSPVTFSEAGPGSYRVAATVAGDSVTRRTQLVFRFAVDRFELPGDVVVTGDLRLAVDGDTVGEATAPAIHIVRTVPAIFVSSRPQLYADQEGAGLAQVRELLGVVTQAAQGSTAVEGAIAAAIYYVDDYSELARDWDNMVWDGSDETTANVVHSAIDALIEDWVEDAESPRNLVIIGDDDVIPLRRRYSPKKDEESDSAGDDPALDLVVSRDFFLTDNDYADTNHSGVTHGDVELDVGRIVGDRPQAMRSLFENGLSGPNYGTPARALLASWAGVDLHYGSGSEGILDHVRAWGFTASSDLVDNSGWEESDLIAALGDDFSLFVHGDHGNPFGLGTPPYSNKGNVSGADIADAMRSWRRPFTAFDDCRVGFTLVDQGLIDRLTEEGISGAVAASGITTFIAEGTEGYSEAVFNRFMRRIMPDSGVPRAVGAALRQAKSGYSPAAWVASSRKAAQVFQLFGIPWMVIPRPTAASGSAFALEPKAPPRFASVESLGGVEHAATVILDASVWSIDTATAPGFELVGVEGFRQEVLEEATVPHRELVIPLPPSAEVSAVTAHVSDSLELGVVALPRYVPGRALLGDDVDPSWTAVPESAGTVPASPVRWEVRDGRDRRELHIHVFPVVYDAASGQATLHRAVEVVATYSSPDPVAVTEALPTVVRCAAGESPQVLLSVANVAATSVRFSVEASLAGGDLEELATTVSGPFDISAGGEQSFAVSGPPVASEGSYRLAMWITVDGSRVGTAATEVAVQVTDGTITEIQVPDGVRGGTVSTVAVTYANTSPSAVDAVFEVEVRSPAGDVTAHLGPETRTIAPGARATVTFPWEVEGALPGTAQVVATVTPGTGTPRRRARPVEVTAPLRIRHRLQEHD